MKDGTVELSEKLAKAEAERDAARAELTKREDYWRAEVLLARKHDVAWEIGNIRGALLSAEARAEAAESALAKSRDAGIALAVELDCIRAAHAARALAYEQGRIVATEEAARLLTDEEEWMQDYAAAIRALAPLPAGLVVVPVDVLERVRNWLSDACTGGLDDDEVVSARAALEALKENKP